MLKFMHFTEQKIQRPIEGLVYHLRLDGIPGVERDLIRNMPVLKHYGNVTKSTDVPSAKFKGSYYFDGSSWVQSKCDDFLYDNLLQSPTYSASFWFKQYGNSPSGVGYANNIAGIGDAHDTVGMHQQLFRIYANGKYHGIKKLKWHVEDCVSQAMPSANLLTEEIIEFNKWYHVVLAFGPVNSAKLYINNVYAAHAGVSLNGPAWNQSANNIIRIGRAAFYDMFTFNSWGWSEPFYGCICDFRVYNTELQPAEIAALYANVA